MQLQSDELWHKYYKETIHRIEDIVLMYDEQGVLVNWNAAAVTHLGYVGQELSELTIQALFTSDLPFFCKKDEVCCKELPSVAVYRKNNTCFEGNVKIIAVGDRYVYGICVIHNIQPVKDLRAQLVTSQKELEHANEARNLFMANMTHELRTPLNGMIGLLAMMEEEELTGRTRQDIHVLQDACRNMETIVNQLLDYSKMVAGKLNASKESFHVMTWLTPILRIHQSLAEQKGLHFEINLDQRIPTYIIGDKEWLGQVLHNLLGNAVKFTKQGSVRLEIAVKEETATQVAMLFVVSDTGIGIKEEQIQCLFKNFSQADPSITREYGGTGLGLAISRGMIEAMNGHLEVESNYSKGSRFYFELALDKGEYKADVMELNNGLKGYIDEALEEQLDSPPIVDATEECDIQYLLSQISLCIEMESWERAQIDCHRVKQVLKNLNPDLGKMAFRLELAVRKQDRKCAEKLCADLSRCIVH